MSDGPTEQRPEPEDRPSVPAHPLSWALRQLQRASAEVDRALAARLDLRPLDFAAMGHVMERPAVIGPVELGHRLGISTGSATELVDRLERAGHLRRERDAEDRRRVALRPEHTAVLGVLEQLRPLIDSLDEVAAQFSPDEQEVVARYLRLAAERFEAFAAEPEA